MQIFVATVDAASFTAASVKLGLSKQFVSRRIMALEERLGVRLLNRSTISCGMRFRRGTSMSWAGRGRALASWSTGKGRAVIARAQ